MPTITPKELRGFPASVATVIRDAVNDHGVTYRLLDGNHVRLYNGNRDTLPLKVSASRPAEASLRYLVPWLEEHVPTWTERPVTDDTLRALADAVNTAPKMDPKPVAEPEPSWVPFIPGSGIDYGFETNGTKFRCRSCGYTQDSGRGVHLHHAKHTGAASSNTKKAAESRTLRAQQRETLLAQAITVLAEEHGLRVTDADPVDADALRAEIDALRANVDRLTRERDDAVTRLSLIKDAMGA